MKCYKVCKVCNKSSAHTSGSSHTCVSCLAKGIKYCNICESSLPIDRFSNRKSLCKKCHSSRSSKANSIRYHSDTSFREKCLEYNVRNKKDRYAIDKEFRLKYITHNKNNRYKRRGATGNHSVTEWNDCLKYFNNSCAYCGATTELTKDHIKPIAKGGANYINNIVPACSTCNKKKGTKCVELFTTTDKLINIRRYIHEYCE